jgi:hypothetical protein
MGHVARRLFIAPPMPELAMPEPGIPAAHQINQA